MLKKAGLIVAASAASLLALSPLAFAHDEDHGNGGDQNASSVVGAANGNDLSVPAAVCGNDAQVGLVPVQNIDPNVPVDVPNLLGEDSASQQASDATDTQACGQGGDSGE